MGKLDARVVLVTGGGTGIGRRIAEACALAGAKVVVCGRREEPLKATCEAIGERARYVTGDITRAGDPSQIVNFVREAFGHLHGLVNNAAIFRMNPVAQTPDAEFEQVFRVNVLGLLAMCREAIPALAETKGAIVSMSSVVGQGVLPGSVPYAGSKAAVEQITRCLAAEVGSLGVRVNAVAPGLTETDMAEGLLSDPAAVADTIKGTPLGRIGTPDDIAPVVIHLLSDEARWVTGQVVQASGGLLL